MAHRAYHSSAANESSGVSVAASARACSARNSALRHNAIHKRTARAARRQSISAAKHVSCVLITEAVEGRSAGGLNLSLQYYQASNGRGTPPACSAPPRRRHPDLPRLSNHRTERYTNK
ncbi:unnamed protein product [Danaus chrysippus]|uniref:(African queen) hypothetical protein n=1 Tax=Danaus chrysippus TaxID=151541 RepID=A0A8J2MI10_9NEOP|nr:unnamed protein product [Danaus chrysippus]